MESIENIVNVPYIVTTDHIRHLPKHEQTLVQAYEYVICDEWGKGRPAPFFTEIKNIRVGRPKKNSN
jgi:hypothetical protein